MKEAFKTGMTVMTRGVANRITEDPVFGAFVLQSFARYMGMDWGDLDEDDARQR